MMYSYYDPTWKPHSRYVLKCQQVIFKACVPDLYEILQKDTKYLNLNEKNLFLKKIQFLP